MLGMQWGWMDVLATLAIMFVLAFVWYAVLPMAFWKRRGIPSASAVPLLGSLTNATLLRKSLGEVYAEIYNDFQGKKYVGCYKFCRPAVVLRDTELIKNILTRDFTHFNTNDVHVEHKNDILSGRHLFVISGERWKRLRMVLSPGFSSGKMKAIYPLIGEICGNLRTFLTEHVDTSPQGSYEVELKDLCARYTTDVVASVAFGLQCDAINNPTTEFRRMGKKFMEPSPINALLFLIIFEIPWLNNLLQVPFVPHDVADFFRSVVRSVVERREEDGTNRSDYLQQLMELWKEGKLDVDRKEDEPKIQRTAKMLKDNTKELDDLTAQALGFFADGFETSSMLISFALFECAHNPDVQEKLRAEIEAKKSEHGGTLTYEAVQDMTYMDMVLKETLRKYPPGLFITRICTKRYYMPNPVGEAVEGGMWMEEGMPVVIPIYALHKDPEFYPDPEKFDPERFSPETKKNQFAYMPFGEGPRICIGNRFAFLQAKLGMITVISRFKLFPNERSPVPIIIDPNHFMMASKKGQWVHLRNLEG